MMRFCNKCGIESKYNELTRTCKQCKRLYDIQYREKNGGKRLDAKGVRRLSGKAYIDARKCALKRKYNLSLQDYDNMLKSQKNKCAICGTPGGTYKFYAPLFIDHCHKTGKVRGLLCGKCNSSIGHMEDSIERLKNAIKYLKNYQ